MTREMMLRIVQSIPSTSPLVESAKLWLAQVEELTGEAVVSSQNFLSQSKAKGDKALPSQEQGLLFAQEDQDS